MADQGKILGVNRKDYVIKDGQPIKLLNINSVRISTGLSARQISYHVKARKFPAPIKISPSVRMWLKNEVDMWIDGTWGLKGN